MARHNEKLAREREQMQKQAAARQAARPARRQPPSRPRGAVSGAGDDEEDGSSEEESEEVDDRALNAAAARLRAAQGHRQPLPARPNAAAVRTPTPEPTPHTKAKNDRIARAAAEADAKVGRLSLAHPQTSCHLNFSTAAACPSSLASPPSPLPNTPPRVERAMAAAWAADKARIDADRQQHAACESSPLDGDVGGASLAGYTSSPQPSPPLASSSPAASSATSPEVDAETLARLREQVSEGHEAAALALSPLAPCLLTPRWLASRTRRAYASSTRASRPCRVHTSGARPTRRRVCSTPRRSTPPPRRRRPPPRARARRSLRMRRGRARTRTSPPPPPTAASRAMSSVPAPLAPQARPRR